MKRTATVLTAALAVPGLLAFSGTADKISFSPTAGSSVVKTFTSTTTMELDDMGMTMNGEPSPMTPDMEMSMEIVNTITVTDEYGATSEGRPASLSRTYDAIGAEMEMDVVVNMMGNEDSQSPSGSGSSELEGTTVVFKWNGDSGEYDIAFAEGEEGDEDLLENLAEDMDLRGLLPSEDIAAGDGYDIELTSLIDVLAPGGDLKMDMEVDGESAMGGPDPAMMSDFRRFFEDMLEGKASGKFTGTRDAGGVQVAVIEIEIEIDASADMADMASELMGGEEMPAEVSIDRLDIQMTYEGAGELLWNMSKGHVHGLDLKADISIGMDMAMAMDMGGQSMDLGMEMAMSGTLASKVATE
ncbi:MAG: hypothetical protein AAF726_00435 [Planctomycetota bacterium]